MRRRLVLIMGIIALASCSEVVTPAGPTPESIVGSWVLMGVDGVALPATLSTTGSILTEITGGFIAIEAGDAFTQKMTFRNTVDGVASSLTVTQQGTWALNGTVVRFTYANLSVGTAPITGDSFTLSVGATSYLYERQ